MSRFTYIEIGAVVALTLTLACAPVEQGSNSAPDQKSPPAEPGASTSQGMSPNTPIGQSKMQPPSVSDKTKTRDEEWERRVNELSARLGPEQRQLREAMYNGEWQNVLDLAASLEAQWAASGLVTVHYSRERAEAHIGLGHPQEAILLLDPDPKHRDSAKNLTHALALAMTDELDAEGARMAADACTRYFNDIPREYVPTPTTRAQKIATVRTARAVDAEASAQDAVVLREAREALRLDPSQKIAAYVLAEAAQRKELWAEAKANYLIASTLPGSLGKNARDRYEIMSN